MEKKRLINLIVMERMTFHYRRLQKAPKAAKRDAKKREKLLLRYDRLASALGKEGHLALNNCLDELLGVLSANNERYYRAGVEDGLCIHKWIKHLKKQRTKTGF